MAENIFGERSTLGFCITGGNIVIAEYDDHVRFGQSGFEVSVHANWEMVVLHAVEKAVGGMNVASINALRERMRVLFNELEETARELEEE